MATGDIADKIRTYNWPNDRITDHRINSQKFGIKDMLSGRLLEEFIKELRENERKEQIEALLTST